MLTIGVPFRAPLLLIVACFFVPGLSTLSHAQSKQTSNQTGKALKEVDASLKLSAKTLRKNKTKRTKTQKKVDKAEKEIAQNQTRSKQTDEKIAATKAQLRVLTKERLTIKTQLNQNKGSLGDLLQASYLMGKQSNLKIALSEQGAQHASRLKHYAKILSDAQQQKLVYFSGIQDTLVKKNIALNKQNTELTNLNQTLAEDHQHLASLKAKRLALLQTLDQTITDNNDKISRLKQRKNKLEKLLKEITRQQKKKALAAKKRMAKKAASTASQSQSQNPRPNSDKRNIKRKKLSPNQSLPLPVKAKIVARFGDKRRGSGLPWSGILLQGKAGSDVRVISAGEVVYADWLQGYGQLIIIDHGKGIMSLYGHNQSIHHRVGDEVKQSAIIASMGDTAGLKKPALYFEIRQNGVAKNPLKWCRI